MKTKIKLLLAVVMWLAVKSAHAQSVNVNDASATMNVSTGNPSLYDGTFMVTLSDTNNISDIQVSLGTGSGLTDVVIQDFVFDVTTGLPSGYSYSRSGNTVTLGIGTYTDKSTLFGAAKVKDSGGTWSSPYQFVMN